MGYAAAVHIKQATTIAMVWLRRRIEMADRSLGGSKDEGSSSCGWQLRYADRSKRRMQLGWRTCSQSNERGFRIGERM